MSKAYVIGYGQTKCGFFPERDISSLLAEAYNKAIESSGVDPRAIQQTWLSHFPLQDDGQATTGQVVVDAIGLGSRVGCVTIENACCSGSATMHDVILGIESGRYDCVLVLGVAKMADSLRQNERVGVLDVPVYRDLTLPEIGYTPLFWHAGIIINPPRSSEYVKTNITPEDIASWNVLQYWYSVTNPNSLCYGERIPTKEELVAIGGGQGGATGCDGASAIILGSREFAKNLTDKLVYVAGMSFKAETSNPAKILDYGYGGDAGRFVGQTIYSHSVENAWQEVFDYAKLKPADVDFLLPHDCTLTVVYAHLEGLKHPLIKPGRAPKWFTEGEAYPDGKLPCCTLGSARFGQPRGALGLNYIIEGYQQLAEQRGDRQVPIKNGIAAGGNSPGRPAFWIMRREM